MLKILSGIFVLCYSFMVIFRVNLVFNMVMKIRGDKCHPGRGKRVKISLLPNNVGKKSANDAGPKQGHET